MSDALVADHFPEFFRFLHGDDEGHGPDPFPWQRRLVNHVAETGEWPALLDLPTGSGKTATLDAAVFLLALRDDQPRRVVFVVDRRIVVHQTAQRAEQIAKRLQEARGGVLFNVAQRLRDLANLGLTQRRCTMLSCAGALSGTTTGRDALTCPPCSCPRWIRCL